MVIIVSRQNGYKEVQRPFISEIIMPATAKQRMSVSRGLVVLGSWNSANSSQVLFQSQMATSCPASFFPWYEKNDSVASASVHTVRKSWWPRTALCRGGSRQAKLLPLGLPGDGVWFGTTCYLLVYQSGVWVH